MIRIDTMRKLHNALTSEPQSLFMTENGSSKHLRYCRRFPTNPGAVFVGTYDRSVSFGQFVEDIEAAHSEFMGTNRRAA